MRSTLVTAMITRISAAVLVLSLVTGPTLQGTRTALAISPTYSDVQIGEMQDIVSHYRDVFGGLAGDPRTSLVTIYLSSSASQSRQSLALAAISVVGTAADPKQQSKPKRWSVQYGTAGPSLAALDAVAQKVAQAQPWRTDVGDRLITWGIDPSRHAVVIGLQEITPTIATDASLAFGSLAVLTLVERPRDLDRLIDLPQPYWGGDRLVVGGPGQCTSGFVAFDPSVGHRGMLTAGHCWNLGVTVNQGYIDTSGQVHTSGQMGKVTHFSFSDNVIDAEFLDADVVGTSLYPKVYRDSCCLSYDVTDSGSSFVGLFVCFSGSFTLENCSGIVQAIDQCALIDGVTSCNLTRAVSTDGTRMCDGGDSGGPTYATNPTGATALGLIKAGNPAGTNCYYSQVIDALSQLGFLALVVV